MISDKLNSLRVKIFADGADEAAILSMNDNHLIAGITTNPSLMKKSGVKNYENFAKNILNSIKTKPVSFEVLSDEFGEMKRQALKISSWQDNVYVKIPITNSRGQSSAPLIKDLSDQGVRINVTAILTIDQVAKVIPVLNPKVPSIVSIFAGRIADTGIDPKPMVKESLTLLKPLPKCELLWASVREVLNIFQAEECGCNIITVPNDILNKALKLVGTDLAQLSMDTVRTFKDDAAAAGFLL